MKKILIVFFIPATILVTACHHSAGNAMQMVKLNNAWLDSVIKRSDTSYSKPYKRPDFVTASYYISRKDSSEMQVMRDSAQQVRQVVISRKNIRSYFAQYYANGQLMSDLKPDEYGHYQGPAVYYYENGSVKSKGNYLHGLSTGEWTEYDEVGNETKIKYDSNGTRLK